MALHNAKVDQLFGVVPRSSGSLFSVVLTVTVKKGFSESINVAWHYSISKTHTHADKILYIKLSISDSETRRKFGTYVKPRAGA